MRVDTKSAREALAVMRPMFRGTKTISFDLGIRPEADHCLFIGHAPGMQVSIPVICDGATELAISGKKLGDIVSTINTEDFLLQEGQLRAGRSRFTMPTGNLENFPFFKSQDAESPVTFKSKLATLERVGVAAGENHLQPAFNGLCFSSQGGKVFLVATDTHRLHADILKGVTIPDGSWIIPNAAIPFAAKIIGGGPIEVTLTGRWASLKNEQGASFYTSLIDASYPDWRKVVPKEISPWFTCNAQELLEIFRQASLIGAKDNRVSFTPNMAEGSVRIESTNAETGESFVAEISATVETQTDQKSFNSVYLAEAIAGYAGEQATIHVATAKNPTCMVKNHEGAAILVGIRD